MESDYFAAKRCNICMLSFFSMLQLALGLLSWISAYCCDFVFAFEPYTDQIDIFPDTNPTLSVDPTLIIGMRMCL